jgi:hypothetical protein
MTEKKLYLGSYMHMRHIFYLNTVSIALEAGETGWTEMFINKYKDEVFTDFRENSFNLANSILHYWKKDYDNALNFAAKVTVEEFAFKVNIRSLYLKIYYDLNETEPFYSHIDALRHFYTKNKEVPRLYRALLADYAGYSKKLFDLKNNELANDYEITKLKKEISANKSLINKTWLLKKVTELEKK